MALDGGMIWRSCLISPLTARVCSFAFGVCVVFPLSIIDENCTDAISGDGTLLSWAATASEFVDSTPGLITRVGKVDIGYQQCVKLILEI